MVGGVGRIDVEYLSRDASILLTVFASEDLPITVLPTSNADELYDKYVGTAALTVPQGDKERMKKWTGLAGKSLETVGTQNGGAADIVLSSVGWAMVTSEDADIHLKAWTPGGKGISMREPILPYYASLRGKRIPGTYLYQTKPIDFPVNVRRQKSNRKKRTFD